MPVKSSPTQYEHVANVSPSDPRKRRPRVVALFGDGDLTIPKRSDVSLYKRDDDYERIEFTTEEIAAGVEGAEEVLVDDADWPQGQVPWGMINGHPFAYCTSKYGRPGSPLSKPKTVRIIAVDNSQWTPHSALGGFPPAAAHFFNVASYPTEEKRTIFDFSPQRIWGPPYGFTFEEGFDIPWYRTIQQDGIRKEDFYFTDSFNNPIYGDPPFWVPSREHHRAILRNVFEFNLRYLKLARRIAERRPDLNVQFVCTKMFYTLFLRSPDGDPGTELTRPAEFHTYYPELADLMIGIPDPDSTQGPEDDGKWESWIGGSVLNLMFHRSGGGFGSVGSPFGSARIADESMVRSWDYIPAEIDADLSTQDARIDTNVDLDHELNSFLSQTIWPRFCDYYGQYRQNFDYEKTIHFVDSSDDTIETAFDFFRDVKSTSFLSDIWLYEEYTIDWNVVFGEDGKPDPDYPENLKPNPFSRRLTNRSILQDSVDLRFARSATTGKATASPSIPEICGQGSTDDRTGLEKTSRASPLRHPGAVRPM